MNFLVAMILMGQVGSGVDSQPPSPTDFSNSNRFNLGTPREPQHDASAVSHEIPPSRPGPSRATVGDGTSIPGRGPAPVTDHGQPPRQPASREPAPREPAPRGPAPRRPASPAEPTATVPPRGPSQALQVASDLIREILAWDEQEGQVVRKVRLVEAVARTGDARSQSAAINAYWGLTQAIAEARYAAGHAQMLAGLAEPPPASEHDRSILESAIAQADAEADASQDAVLAAQYRLLRVSAIPWDGFVPWPTDLPLVDAYRTNFDSYFAQRPAPLDVRHIHHSLPRKLQLIERRVAAVAASEAATDAAIASHKRRETPLTMLLLSVDRMEQAQRDFVTAVIDYNELIAEYSLATVGATLGPEKLVATLIRTDRADSSLVNIPRGVRTAGGNLPVTADKVGPRR